MGLAARSLPHRTWATQLRTTADAPAQARWFFWSTVSPHGMPAEPETAVLLLSELVSNAARYGDRDAPIELVITLSGEDLGVLVREPRQHLRPRGRDPEVGPARPRAGRPPVHELGHLDPRWLR